MSRFFCSVIILITIIYNLHNNKLDSVKTIVPFTAVEVKGDHLASCGFFTAQYSIQKETFHSGRTKVFMHVIWSTFLPVCGHVCRTFHLKFVCKVVWFLLFLHERKVKLFYQSEVSFFTSFLPFDYWRWTASSSIFQSITVCSLQSVWRKTLQQVKRLLSSDEAAWI